MDWKRKGRVVRLVSSGLLLIAVSCFLSSQTAWAIGLEVDPGEIKIKDVPLGKVVKASDLGGEGMKIRIKNTGSSACAYTINILHTAKTKGTLKEGYTDIPDTSWLWPEEKEVLIPAYSVKEVEIFLKIPAKEEYYNKKHQAAIEVKSKKNRPEEIFVLACRVRMRFSTEPTAEQKARVIARIAQQKEEKRLKAQREEKESAKHPRTIIILKSRDKWTEDPTLLAWLKNEFPKSSIRTVDYSSRKGKRLARKLKIDFLPACIFSKDIEKNKKFTALRESKSLIKQGRYYVWSAAGRGGIFIKRERIPGTLEVFYMSQCPIATKALEEIITAKKDGRLPAGLTLDYHYIAQAFMPCDKPGEMQFKSFHGPAEVEEDIRQLCIKKNEPDKLEDYLLVRNKDITNADWEVPAKQAGVDTEVIKKCRLYKNEWRLTLNEKANSQLTEGETLFLEDISKALGLKITSSPAFLYENRILILDFKRLKELPGLGGL